MKVIFSMLYFFLFLGLSSVSGMLIPFLRYKGYEPIQVGYLISIFTLMGVFGQLGVGYFCDKFKTIKKVFLASLFVIIFSGSLSFLLQKSIPFYIVFFSLGMFASMIVSLIDTWVMESEEHIKESFGKLRCFGSFGWAFGVLITGYITSKYGYNVVNTLFVIVVFISIILTFKLNDIVKENTKKIKLKNLILNKQYDSLVFSLLTVSICYRSYLQLIPYIIESIGKSTLSIGIYFFLSSLSDIVMFAFCSKIMHKVSPDKLLLLAPISILMQLILIYFKFDLTFIYLSCILNIFTFPVILMVGRIMVDRVCEKELKTTSQLIGFAMYNSLGIIVASFLVGFLIENFGISKTIVQLMFITVFSIITVIIYDKKTVDEVI